MEGARCWPFAGQQDLDLESPVLDRRAQVLHRHRRDRWCGECQACVVLSLHYTAIYEEPPIDAAIRGRYTCRVDSRRAANKLTEVK